MPQIQPLIPIFLPKRADYENDEDYNDKLAKAQDAINQDMDILMSLVLSVMGKK